MYTLKPAPQNEERNQTFFPNSIFFFSLLTLGFLLVSCNSSKPTVEHASEKFDDYCPKGPNDPGRNYQYVLNLSDHPDIGSEKIESIRDTFLQRVSKRLGKDKQDEQARKCLCDSTILLIEGTGDYEESVTSSGNEGEDEWIGKELQPKIFDPLNDYKKRWNPSKSKPASFPSKIPRGTNDVVVALIDMGIDYYSHENLYELIWQPTKADNTDYFPFDSLGYDFGSDGEEPPLDGYGHGTHMAGIIAGEITDGLKIMNLRVSNKRNPKEVNSLNDIPEAGSRIRGTGKVDLFSAACAMAYAIKHGADIIHISWGYYDLDTNRIFRPLLKRALEKEILVVTSAGNKGLDTDHCYHWPSFNKFADTLNNIVVAAALNRSETSLAPYSNYGYRSTVIAAPGTDIESTLPGTFGWKKRKKYIQKKLLGIQLDGGRFNVSKKKFELTKAAIPDSNKTFRLGGREFNINRNSSLEIEFDEFVVGRRGTATGTSQAAAMVTHEAVKFLIQERLGEPTAAKNNRGGPSRNDELPQYQRIIKHLKKYSKALKRKWTTETDRKIRTQPNN